MRKIYDVIIRFWSNPRNVYVFGLLIALAATAIEVFRGRNTNYFDYQDSTRMFWEGISPYNLEYAMAHEIYFLYLPVFSVLFAPIFFLPWWLGPFVWNVCNYTLAFLAVWTLPRQLAPHRLKIFLFLLSVLLQAVFCYQYNTIIFYIFLFAFNLLERGKALPAVLLIMISACTKIYGGAELAILFFYPKAVRNFCCAALFGVILLALPLLNTNMENPMGLYAQVFDMISSHHGDTDFVGILFARGLKPFLLPHYREVQMVVLGILAIAFFASYKRWSDFKFRAQALGVLMGFVILFSDCPETHTYLIALAGYQIAFWVQPDKKWFDWVLFWLLIVNFGVLPTDVLCPAWLHDYIHTTFWLDVYCFALCWLRTIWWALAPQPYNNIIKEKAVAVMLLLMLPAVGAVAQTTKGAADASAHSGREKGAVAQQRPQQRTFIVRGVVFNMKYVEGGTFTMGAQRGDTLADADERPAHRVVVNSFYMGETEVTQALWEAVMHKNRSKVEGPQNPVEYVTYEDCHRFIDSLRAITGLPFRLPTEAEWEYAARGGKKSRGYLYAGSNDLDEVAWMHANSAQKDSHSPVAQKKPNELGLYDMSGNVMEWCEDYYGKYSAARQVNPVNQRKSSFHVIRGGAYNSFAPFCRTTNRYMYDTRRRRVQVGLRLVLGR